MFSKTTIVITNYAIAVKIFTQTILSTTNIDKLNLCLIRVLQYLFTINLKLYYKLDKEYIVSNTLLRLYYYNSLLDYFEELDRIDIFYIYTSASITAQIAAIAELSVVIIANPITLITKSTSVILLQMS